MEVGCGKLKVEGVKVCCGEKEVGVVALSWEILKPLNT